jgi:hypothetical protein
MTGAQIDGDLNAGTVGGWNISTDNSGNGWLGYTATFKEGTASSNLYDVYSESFIGKLMGLKFDMRFNKVS